MKSVRIASVNVLVFASIFLQSTTLVFAEDRWASDMAKFAKQDKQLSSATGGIVFVGSSSIRLWDLKKSFDKLQTIPLNRGFGGSQLADSIRHVELLVIKHKPRAVVIYAGDNDIAAGKTVEKVASDFDKLVELIHQSLPETKIAYIAIKPSLARWNLAEAMSNANACISKRCDADERLHFVDIWKPMLGEDGKPRSELFVKDGLHLNDRGYKLWTSLVQAAIEQKETEGAGLEAE